VEGGIGPGGPKRRLQLGARGHQRLGEIPATELAETPVRRRLAHPDAAPGRTSGTGRTGGVVRTGRTGRTSGTG
jgi:hypothetical protein